MILPTNSDIHCTKAGSERSEHRATDTIVRVSGSGRAAQLSQDLHHLWAASFRRNMKASVAQPVLTQLILPVALDCLQA